jgi:hypothetical protein
MPKQRKQVNLDNYLNLVELQHVAQWFVKSISSNPHDVWEWAKSCGYKAVINGTKKNFSAKKLYYILVGMALSNGQITNPQELNLPSIDIS